MMRNFPNLILAVVLFTSKCTLAQDAAVPVIQHPEVAKVPSAGGSISGKVVCADTHTPARGARILVMPVSATGQAVATERVGSLPHMANTALDGTFRVLHLPPGEYAVIAAAAGYLSPLDGVIASRSADSKATEDLLREKAPLVRISGQEAARVEIELQRGAILTGKVVYSDGSSATQLRVLLQNVAIAKSEGKPDDLYDAGVNMEPVLLRQVARTDDQGHFRISGIPGGRYRLAIIQNLEVEMNFGEAMFENLNPGITRSDKLVAYSGNTFHRKDAKVYELRPGETVDGVEVVLPLTNIHSVQGVATGKDGARLNFGVVNLSDTADSNINLHTNIREGGEFRFIGIPEGTYEIKITRGFIVENPPNFEVAEEQVLTISDQFKPLRAFAETKVAVTVQTTDVDDLAIVLADTKLPEQAVPAADSETSHVVIVHPQ
jgi:hypothetical protein